MIEIIRHKEIDEIILSNEIIQASFLNYGAYMKSIKYLNQELLVNYDNPSEYLNDNLFLGAYVGRYANRIENSQFYLNDKLFELNRNENNNHLHGGENSFNKRFWDYEIIDNYTVRLFIDSHDSDNGYPGHMFIENIISIKNSELEILFSGISNQDTIFGPTYHPYFNLNNDDDAWGNLLWINADKYIEVNEELIPTAIKVCENNFDYSSIKKIATSLDHCFILNDEFACILKGEKTEMKILTDYPGVQIYTGDNIKHKGIAIEPEFFPNSPNRKDFPSAILKENERFLKYIIYQFS